MIRNGWEIYFHRNLFGEQRRQLKEQVKQLKVNLPLEEFVKHSTVKLLAAVMVGIKEKIVLDPFAPQFALKGALRHYGRLKGMGLSDRYRLFFRAFESGGRKVLIVLWLGFPRKEGDKYEFFSRMVHNGDFPENLEQMLSETDVI
ncbi:type II toxin-antitoxin system YhaV family toxin [Pseudanabaena sp. ABRG5-3]|uniref:type II toxin-antitoxin system YhaV family toxin n=1 Tax=Pseudanabaena sp. ABRG5-3 TaxID=685565 RepID=UPI000F82AD34